MKKLFLALAFSAALFAQTQNTTVNGVANQQVSSVSVSNGGTGDSTLTAHGVLIGEGTSAVAESAAGSSGQAFLSGGASADGAFAALNLAGGSNIFTGLLPVANGGTGTASPGLVAGTNVTITGSWPNQTVNAAGTVITGAVNAVSFSATPTFNAALGSFQTMTLTGNVTGITISNLVAGQLITFDFAQDATGSRTVAGWPAAVHGNFTIGATASKHNVQQFYSPDGTNLYALGTGVINQ